MIRELGSNRSQTVHPQSVKSAFVAGSGLHPEPKRFVRKLNNAERYQLSRLRFMNSLNPARNFRLNEEIIKEIELIESRRSSIEIYLNQVDLYR